MRTPTTVAQAEETTCTPAGNVPVRLRLGVDEAGRLAEACKALGHPVRLQIVELLSRYGGQVCVCEIERHFALAQPTISHHLRVLRESGLVAAEQRGLWVYYDIQPEAIARLRALLGEFETASAGAPPVAL